MKKLDLRGSTLDNGTLSMVVLGGTGWVIYVELHPVQLLDAAELPCARLVSPNEASAARIFRPKF